MSADPAIGVDIKLTRGDLGYTRAGDLALVGDVSPEDNIWQAVVLRLTTILGTHLFAPNYGTRLGQYVDEPVTDDLESAIIAEAKTTILQDPRVASVSNMVMDASQNDQLSLSFSFTTISGQSKSGTVSIGG